jgi:hypothetical protein
MVDIDIYTIQAGWGGGGIGADGAGGAGNRRESFLFLNNLNEI